MVNIGDRVTALRVTCAIHERVVINQKKKELLLTLSLNSIHEELLLTISLNSLLLCKLFNLVRVNKITK